MPNISLKCQLNPLKGRFKIPTHSVFWGFGKIEMLIPIHLEKNSRSLVSLLSFAKMCFLYIFLILCLTDPMLTTFFTMVYPFLLHILHTIYISQLLLILLPLLRMPHTSYLPVKPNSIFRFS